MYIITRDDLSPGLQCAQVAHAAFHFGAAHSQVTDDWLQQSNFLVVCSVPDEVYLADLAGEAFRRGISRIIVREPDVNNEITAIALAPGPWSRRLCASLPLALKHIIKVNGTPVKRIYTDADAEAWVDA